MFIVLLIVIWALRSLLQRRGSRKNGRWNRRFRGICTLALRFENNSCRSCLLFCFFGERKKLNLLKALFSFIPCLLNSSDLLSSGSESKKRYRPRPLLMYVEERGVLKVALSWEGDKWFTWVKEGFPWGTWG